MEELNFKPFRLGPNVSNVRNVMPYTNSGSHVHNKFYFGLTLAEVHSEYDTLPYPAGARVTTNVFTPELKSQLK